MDADEHKLDYFIVPLCTALQAGNMPEKFVFRQGLSVSGFWQTVGIPIGHVTTQSIASIAQSI